MSNSGPDLVNHPPHYRGEGDPYEPIKVIEAWGLGFNLGNTIKYIARLGRKDDDLLNLKKAWWYLDREIQLRESARTPNEAGHRNPDDRA